MPEFLRELPVLFARPAERELTLCLSISQGKKNKKEKKKIVYGLKGESKQEGKEMKEVKEKPDCAQIVVSLFTEPARISNYDERGCPRSGVPMKNSI